MAASKLGYLCDVLRADSDLPDDLNGFQRDWLLQIFLSALLADAAITGRSIDVVAADLLDEDRLEGVFHGVMDELFGAIPPGLQDNDEVEDDDRDDDSEDYDSSGAGQGSAVWRRNARVPDKVGCNRHLRSN